jgi:aryl-alcohol dehydrogenase-like predicted oxidoreductase
MGTSFRYGPAKEEQSMISGIRSAVDLGVTSFDTAEVYGPVYERSARNRGAHSIRMQVLIASKFRFQLDADGKRAYLGRREKHRLRGSCATPSRLC